MKHLVVALCLLSESALADPPFHSGRRNASSQTETGIQGSDWDSHEEAKPYTGPQAQNLDDAALVAWCERKAEKPVNVEAKVQVASR